MRSLSRKEVTAVCAVVAGSNPAASAVIQIIIGSWSPRWSVKPVSIKKWGGDERFDSFATQSRTDRRVCILRNSSCRQHCWIPVVSWAYADWCVCSFGMLMQVGRCSASFHKAGRPGSIPGPATFYRWIETLFSCHQRQRNVL